ncbi:MAG TPA: PqqD family protein [Chloroflexota bacterium]
MPRARETGLVVRELDEETVVYDLERNEAHCLTPAAASVWKRCDGSTTVSDIAGMLRHEDKLQVEEDTVWAALTLLGKLNLLEEQVSRRTARTMSRRDMMRRAGMTVGVGLPLITSLSVLTAQGVGASVACIAAGAHCDPLHLNCCSPHVCKTSIGRVCNNFGNCTCR